MKKEQFNARIRPDLKRAASTVAAALDWTKEEIAEVALANLLGTRDELMIVKKRKAEKVSRELNLSFNPVQDQLLGLAE